MKKLIVLTGAGISAESGISTFRDKNGLWENHDVMEVASPMGWENNRELVLRFYNERRKQLLEVSPNNAHFVLKELESYFDVQIITQNVDDLHERAGSTKVLHLHGELKKVRSTVDPSLVFELDGWELKLGDKCPKGSQLRPHIVWFHEEVPEMANAIKMARTADIFLIVGTSLNVYPAAGLIDYVDHKVPVFLIDPGEVGINYRKVQIVKEKATSGLEYVKNILLEKYK